MAGQPLVLGIEQPPGGLRFDPATGSVRCRNVAAYDQVNFDARMPSWCSIAM